MAWMQAHSKLNYDLQDGTANPFCAEDEGTIANGCLTMVVLRPCYHMSLKVCFSVTDTTGFC